MNLLLPGMLSVTFRSLSVDRIVKLAAESQLAAIEWGGDVHVPHGDLNAAKLAKRLCRDHGIKISAYGSYFRAGAGVQTNPQMDAMLDCAAELETSVVRVWAGDTSSRAATAAQRMAVAESLIELCDEASERGIDVATEFHSGTLTDEISSALALFQAVGRENLRTMWQPPNGMEFSAARETLRQVMPWLANVHVFHWWPSPDVRLPLVQGAGRWSSYLSDVAANCAVDRAVRFASLEFVKGDDEQQFREDAETLRRWIDEIPLIEK